MTTSEDQISSLKPVPESFDPVWSQATLATILADPAPLPGPRPWWRKTRRRAAALIAAVVVAFSAGTAVAVGGASQVVKDGILDFSERPNTTGNGLRNLHDPVPVAKFRTREGIFAMWVATSSSGQVCTAETNGLWDGKGVPTRRELEFGCGGMLNDPTAPGGETELTRPEQLGGFFKDSGGPIIYGVAPNAAAVQAHVQGVGVDRMLPIRTDSHGYGAAIPEASGAKAVTVTFLDDAGHAVGSKRWVAPVG